MTASLPRARLAALRAIAQGVDGPGAPSPAEAVSRLLCIQAQDVLAPLAAVAARTRPRPDRGTVEVALATGAVVRSWVLRGTLHLIAPADLGWLLPLTGPRSLALGRTVRLREGVDDEVLRRAAGIVAAALCASGLPRDELLATLQRRGVDTGGSRGYHVLTALAAEGRIVVGGREAGQVRIHPAPATSSPLPRDEALARLAVRYAAGHGPVTVRDLAWWSGLTVGDARLAVQAAGAALTAVEVAGVPHVVLADADLADAVLADAGDPPPAALPAFDELYLGYRDRSAALDPARHVRLAPTANGRFLPFVAQAGRVVATWAAGSEPHVTPIVPLDAQTLAAAEAAAVAATAWQAG